MYTLISYKPDSTDYCKGCLMDSYPSDFIFESYLDENTLSQKLTQIFYDNEFLGCGEDGHKFIIMKDGITLCNMLQNISYNNLYGLESFYFTDFTDEENEIYKQETQKLNKIIIQAKDNAISQIKTEKQEKERKELAEAKRKQEENKKRQEENDKKTYERLKKKFESIE